MNRNNANTQIYAQKVELLLRLMPIVMEDGVFAVHGGTAINLFLKNLPRYSVDIDLTYTPLADRNRDLCKTALVFPTLQRSGGRSVIKGKNSWKMRLGRASLTHIFPLFDAIGHNDPWRAVQVVGDCLHDVLRVCPGQSHIPCHTGPEPPVH